MMFLEPKRISEHMCVCVCVCVYESSLFNDTVNVSAIVWSLWMNAILEHCWNDNILWTLKKPNYIHNYNYER
jgi:hypothetical protein